MNVVFRPVNRADLPLLRSWMALPHWREWWGDPDVEIGHIEEMLEGRDTTHPYLFNINGDPVGYIQYWHLRDAKRPPWNVQSPWVMDFDDETIGVDLSIGEAKNLSKGIGTLVLQQFVAKLVNEGFTKIIIDPDVENKRAIAAYEKSGFVRIRVAEEQDGSILLMRWKGDQQP